MALIKYFSYFFYLAAAANIVLLLGEEEFAFLGLALAMLLAGALMQALNYGLTILVEIRDALTGKTSYIGPSIAPEPSIEVSETKEVKPSAPVRSIQEIQADIDRLKKGA